MVKAARHEKVELDCSMDPGSIGLDTGPVQGKAKTGLDFRWSLNTSRDQVKLKKLSELPARLILVLVDS